MATGATAAATPVAPARLALKRDHMTAMTMVRPIIHQVTVMELAEIADREPMIETEMVAVLRNSDGTQARLIQHHQQTEPTLTERAKALRRPHLRTLTDHQQLLSKLTVRIRHRTTQARLLRHHLHHRHQLPRQTVPQSQLQLPHQPLQQPLITQLLITPTIFNTIKQWLPQLHIKLTGAKLLPLMHHQAGRPQLPRSTNQ